MHGRSKRTGEGREHSREMIDEVFFRLHWQGRGEGMSELGHESEAKCKICGIERDGEGGDLRWAMASDSETL